MSAKFKLILPFLIIAVLLAGYSFTQNNTHTVKKITLKVTKLKDGTWKVKVDSIDGRGNIPDTAKARVNKKTMITWNVDGTDAYFQFSAEIFDTNASGTNKLKDGYTIHIPPNKPLKLKIKDDDKLVGNTYVYAIFCLKDSTYARGDSPPIIIVN